MTQAQITKLEIKVAVIQNDIVTLKSDTKSVKGLLRWFMVLAVTIIGLVIVNIWSGSGDKKVMQSILIHNSSVIGDMARQGIEKGWYKPSKETYRSPDKKKGES